MLCFPGIYISTTSFLPTIENPEMAKEHIADYFENLYQAREGEKSHQEWTEHINKTVDEIEKKARYPETNSHSPSMN